MNKDAIANLQQQIEEEEFKQSFEAQAAERERQRLAKMTPEELAKLAHDKKVREEREAREREEAERKAREELAELLKDEMIRQQREQAEELERSLRWSPPSDPWYPGTRGHMRLRLRKSALLRRPRDCRRKRSARRAKSNVSR
jgi:hypothetical protein